MDNFNNPNDPYSVGNQNPYTDPVQNDPYSNLSPTPMTDPSNPIVQQSTVQNNDYMPNTPPVNMYNQAPQFNDPYGAPQQNNAYGVPQVTPTTGAAPYYQQYNPQKAFQDEEEKKKANTLCFISLGLYLLPYVLNFIYYWISVGSIDYSNIDNLDYGGRSSGAYLISGLNFISYIAAWVTMIVARVKYKNSTFAKVLMWVYIGMLILGIIAVIIIVVACAAMFNSVLSNCPG